MVTAQFSWPCFFANSARQKLSRIGLLNTNALCGFPVPNENLLNITEKGESTRK
jgi:hypothetical protein